MRRLWASNYFQLVVRVGSRGSQKWPLLFTEVSGTGTATGTHAYEATFKPRKDGELFLFVNDAVVGIPGLADYFYRPGNNRGTAEVAITPAP